MAATSVRSAQITDGTVQRADLSVSGAVNTNVIAKLIQPANGSITLTSTGVDAGTGDVTPTLPSTIPSGAITQLYIGSKARLTALSNGLQLEVQDSGGTWHTEVQWTE